jgi:hypothetical protein
VPHSADAGLRHGGTLTCAAWPHDALPASPTAFFIQQLTRAIAMVHRHDERRFAVLFPISTGSLINDSLDTRRRRR